MKNFVLVTGGTGFVGRRLVARLVAEGREVYVTGRESLPPRADHIAADFQSVSNDFLRRCQTVWHLAAETDTRAPDEKQWSTNGADAVAFLRKAHEAGAKCVYASSCAVYGRAPVPFVENNLNQPLNAYGAAKLALDKMAFGFAVGLRPSNVYGPGEEHKGRSASMLSQIVAAVREGRELKLYNRCERDVIAVDDVAEAFHMAERFEPGVYNCATGSTCEYLAAALLASELTGRLLKASRCECPFPTEFQEYTVASVSRIGEAYRRHVGRNWTPKPWREAVREYVSAGWPINEPPTL